MFDGLGEYVRFARETLERARLTEKRSEAFDNTQFLPAALEVLETPPNPLGREILWSILILMIIALAWACLGSVDIVATGQGKIIPRGQVKVIQPAEIGVVRALPVRDGEFVTAGTPLIALDPTVSDAELTQARKALVAAEIDLNQAKALVDYVAGRPYGFVAPQGAEPSLVSAQQVYLRQRVLEQQSTLKALENDREQRAREGEMASLEVLKLKRELPLVEEHLASLENLNKQGYAATSIVNEVRRQAIGIRHDIDIHATEQRKYREAYFSAQLAYTSQRSKYAGEALEALTKAQAVYNQRIEELKKAQDRSGQAVLRSPIDGYAQQLQIHTVGGVVRPADALMVIVPKDAELLVEAQFPNREIGFLRDGQPVEIKLEAFPFTRYGTLTGKLEHINRDATPDEKEGLRYTGYAAISAGTRRGSPLADDQTRSLLRQLRPGMAVTVEVKTGRRRIISYLLSPLLRRVSEAGHER